MNGDVRTDLEFAFIFDHFEGDFAYCLLEES